MRRFLAIGLAIGLLAPGLHAAEGEAARHDSLAARGVDTAAHLPSWRARSRQVCEGR
jgi:hypothetical protein